MILNGHCLLLDFGAIGTSRLGRGRLDFEQPRFLKGSNYKNYQGGREGVKLPSFFQTSFMNDPT